MIKQLLMATAIATITASAYAAETAVDATATTSGAATIGDLFVPQVDASDHLASRLIGVAVYDSTSEDAQSIGKVNDLVVDDSGAIDAVIVGVGGFLGIGEKNVGLSYPSLQWGSRDGSPVLIVATTKDALENAPAFDVSALDQTTTPLQTGVDAAGNTVPANPAVVPVAPVAPDVVTGPAADSLQQMDVASVSANDLINTAVYAADNHNVGEIADVIVAEDGKIDAIVLDVGGFLGIGEKPVAIAFDGLHIR
jgi:sporulation protein YlmC with PRC-barrel domain